VLGFVVNQRLSRKNWNPVRISRENHRRGEKEAENIKKEAILQAKENLLKVKTEFEKIRGPKG